MKIDLVHGPGRFRYLQHTTGAVAVPVTKSDPWPQKLLTPTGPPAAGNIADGIRMASADIRDPPAL